MPLRCYLFCCSWPTTHRSAVFSLFVSFSTFSAQFEIGVFVIFPDKRTSLWIPGMGIGRGASTPWILKVTEKKVVFLVSSGKNKISPLLPPPGKNPSDAHDTRLSNFPSRRSILHQSQSWSKTGLSLNHENGRFEAIVKNALWISVLVTGVITSSFADNCAQVLYKHKARDARIKRTNLCVLCASVCNYMCCACVSPDPASAFILV